MEVGVVVNEDAKLCIFHDQPFEKDLAWIEFDLDSNSLDFVLEEGEMRNAGFPVDPDLSAYMQNAHMALVVRTANDEMQEGIYMPLIIHRA